MFNWWENLGILHQVLYLIAIPSTIILVLQTILLLFGLGNNDADVDCADCDVSGGVDLDGDGIPDIIETSDGYIPHDHTYDQGVDHELGLRLFTVRGIISFLVMGSWTAIAALDLGASPAIATLVGFVIGLLALFLVAYFFKAATKLQESGNLDVKNALGLKAEVYLTIPPNGKGKVNLVVQERHIEMDAICPSVTDRPLKTGEQVVVKSVENNVLHVAPIS